MNRWGTTGLARAAAAIMVLVALSQFPAAASSLTCPMQQAREVSFRNATAKDVLEVSIGTGPCERATLTIVIRSDVGHILYSYVAPFKQHVADWHVPELDKEARQFVDGLISQGVESTASLPPWEEPDAYEEKHAGHIDVSREIYEELRAKPRPMLSHPTYYEGWKSVVYDERAGESVVIVTGGV